MDNKIAHVAIATQNLEDAKSFFELISGNKASEVHEVSSQKVNTSFIKIGETHFELLEPIGDDTPITKFLSKVGGGIHHICIETRNFDELIQKIKTTGVRTLGDPSIGAKDKRVIFFHPKDTFNVLIEVEES
jgi:methylmalonyl-CoA/ethylmalonyl-CoA epimerase